MRLLNHFAALSHRLIRRQPRGAKLSQKPAQSEASKAEDPPLAIHASLALALASLDAAECERLLAQGADPLAPLQGLGAHPADVFLHNVQRRWKGEPEAVLRVLEILARFSLSQEPQARSCLQEMMPRAGQLRLPADFMRALKAHGADPNHKSPAGLTALLHACVEYPSQRELIHALLDEGASAALASGSAPGAPGAIGGLTALMQLSRAHKRQGGPFEGEEAQRLEETLNRLVDCGADIDAVDERGESALAHAVDARAAVLVEALLRRGANPLLRNRFGQLPLEAWRLAGGAKHSAGAARAAAALQSQTERWKLAEGIEPAKPSPPREPRRL